MNKELALDLARKAGLEMHLDYDGGVAYQDQFVLFAQLVARECIEVIQLGIARDGHDTPQYKRSMNHLRDIKARFNIED